MTDSFVCTRCDRSDSGLIERPPFPNELGDRLMAEICGECWDEWLQRQMLLINHYGLKLHEPKSREFLYSNLSAFLFGEGEATAEIDTTEEGSVTW